MSPMCLAHARINSRRRGCRLAPCPPVARLAGAWLKEWRKRYFRLIGNKLYFSKDMSVRGGAPSIGVGRRGAWSLRSGPWLHDDFPFLGSASAPIAVPALLPLLLPAGRAPRRGGPEGLPDRQERGGEDGQGAQLRGRDA